MYDYGKEINKVIYQSELPPNYPLQKIKNSLYIIYGDKDELATPMVIF